jgi:uncharacterized repeat protein (TIGR01451 family)
VPLDRRRAVAHVARTVGAVAILVATASPTFAAPADGNRGKAGDPPGRRDTTTTTAAAQATATTSTSTPGKSGDNKRAGATTDSTPSPSQSQSPKKATTTTTATATTAATTGPTVGIASSHGLTIESITWGIIGLDSNDVTVGPTIYPVGVRVCATGDAVTGITVTFTWDSANPFINLISPVSQTISSLAAGACADRYWFVEVTRTAAAYDTARSYHITASAAGVATVSTPTPRELYVERLLSQNRNTVVGIEGPSTVYEGDSVTYTIYASTSPTGYSQLESFLTMLSPVFQVLDVELEFESPAGARTTSPYADACGWDHDPSSPTYRQCVGPENFPGGRVGGSVIGVFSGVVVGTGISTLSNAIIDVSGGSYHYNTDFGTAPNLLVVTALPSADLVLSKTAVGTFTAGGTGTYALTVTNLGPSASGAPLTVTDTLPAGMTFTSASALGWSCSGSQTVTCTRSTAMAAGTSSIITLHVAVADSLSGTQVNTATVSGPARDVNPADNTDTAAVNVLGLVRPTTPGPSRNAPTTPTAGSGRRPTGGAPLVPATGGLPDTRLAVTGVNSVLLALFGAALVLVGSAATRAGRTRPTR